MRCHDFREIADSYLSDELLTETNHDVIAHLESCAVCRRELAPRRQSRFNLRASFVHAHRLQIRDEFADNLRGQLRALALRETKRSAPKFPAWLAMAACLLLALVFELRMVQRKPGHQETPAAGQSAWKEHSGEDAPSAQGSADEDSVLRATMAEISGTAAGDHRDCAINFRLLAMPISLEKAGLKYDRAYLNLSDVASARLPQLSGGMELVESHSCVFNGRRFAHVVLRGHGTLISLLVTDLSRPAGSGKAAKQALSDRTQAVMACSRAGRYQIACFETARHAIFIVSDLTEGENLAVARFLAPGIYDHISHAEDSA